VRREFSAGGVVVRRYGGAWRLAAIRPAGKARVWALPKGNLGRGESAAEAAAREVAEETGLEVVPLGKLGDVRYVYTWEGERVFKVVTFFLFRSPRGRLGTLDPAHRHEVAEARWLPLADAPRLLSYSGERAMAARAAERLSEGEDSLLFVPAGPSPAGTAPVDTPVYALNFYSPIVADQLRSRRKTATIRLGDKSPKYKKGMIVRVLAGQRFGPRELIFDAVIDKIEVKRLGELSPREIQHDNPELRRTDEMAEFLGQIYNRTVSVEDTVTVIHFSEIQAA
jgi:8-oxo-dGTP pyrophosphatase MutT (NUDIX family)